MRNKFLGTNTAIEAPCDCIETRHNEKEAALTSTMR